MFRKKIIFKSSLFICIIVTAFFSVSFLYGLNSNFVYKIDKNHIWENCKIIRGVTNKSEIGSHIVRNRSFFGTVYIFEFVPGKISDNDFEIAARSLYSELSCLPILGCFISPTLARSCQEA